MKTFLILVIGYICLWTVSGQKDGRYRPVQPYTTRRRPNIFDERYRAQRPVDNGRYRPNTYQGSIGFTNPRRPSIDLLASVAKKPSTQGKGSAQGGGNWRTIRLENEVDANGYRYLYETENGILAEEQGRIEALTAGDEGLRTRGFFEYTGDDGLLYRVNYVADDNGFVPEGDHIPKTPPHVGKLLAYLAANAPKNRQ